MKNERLNARAADWFDLELEPDMGLDAANLQSVQH